MFRGLKKRIQHMGSGSSGGGGGARSSRDENDRNLYDDAGIFGGAAARRDAPYSGTSSAAGAPSNSNKNHFNYNGGSSNSKATSPSPTPGAANNNNNNKQPVASRKQLLRKKKQQREQVDDDDDGWMVSSRTPSTTTTTTAAAPALSNFDKCIATSDALTASSRSAAAQKDSILQVRRDPRWGLPDCSLLVSPDGDLLLVPTNSDALFRTLRRESNKNNKNKNRSNRPNLSKDESEQSSSTSISTGKEAHQQEQHAAMPDESETEQQQQRNDNEDDDDDDVGLNQLGAEQPQDGTTATAAIAKTSFSELMRHGRDDYESAVFVGHDLSAQGDQALNRFSGKGWSIPATTLALQQTGHGLTALSRLVGQLALARRETAARTGAACDALRAEAASRHFDLGMGGNDQWEILDAALGGAGADLELGPGRVGPFEADGSTLRRAARGVEHYCRGAAERDARLWRGAGAPIGTAVDQFRARSQQRQQALREASGRASELEGRLRRLKKQSVQRWEAVYRAEAAVSRRAEELLAERSRERQRLRLEKLRRAEEEEAQARNGTAAATEGQAAPQPSNMSEEVWNLVSSVADAHGSFEPVPVESVAPPVSDDASAASMHSIPMGGADQQQPDHAAAAAGTSNAEASNSGMLLPIQSRESMEQEIGLPELRAAALRADGEIQDAADALLNALATLDTTRRSARIAAETCLVSAANAQAACLRSLLRLERESLEERLRDLDGLEQVFDHIDVRADLDDYIAADKKASGGRSHLGDDDDGGIASALAILSSHVDGSMGHDSDSSSSSERRRVSEAQTESDTDDSTSPAKLSEAVDILFEKDARLGPDADETEEATVQARSAFEAGVDLLCQSAAGETSSAKARRSALCYALNSKRTHAKLETQIQFDGVCKLFSAILDGCFGEKGVSNAKMMMMLAQTFYIEKQPAANDSEAQLDESARQERKRRIYVKNQLVGHPIWAKDEFWDVALSQQISESLTHSGVMSNFDRNTKVQSTEWTQTRKPKWYDLTYMERSEAASQVHAVVFAQLGALAHSMIEFGCGLERSCAFVRRMSIRNQLPSSQRTMLLTHLMAREDIDREETKAQLEAGGTAK